MPRGQGRGSGMQRIAIADRARGVLRERSGRRDLLNRCGEKAFLDPSNLKFPVISPLAGDCKPDCKLLYAAYVRAKEWHYDSIAAKAMAMYKSNGCDKKTDVQIKDENKQ